MNGSTVRETLFWNQVLTISEAIAASEAPSDSIGDYLLGLELGFEDMTDPVENFRTYATAMLCRSVRLQLERCRSQTR